MKNYKLKKSVIFLAFISLTPFSLTKAQQPAAQQPPANYKQIEEATEKLIHERFAKAIEALAVASQASSDQESEQLAHYKNAMEQFFYHQVPILFKEYQDSAAFRKVNDALRKEYGFSKANYDIFFDRENVAQVLALLKQQFPNPGAIDFDNPKTARVLKAIILNDIEKRKKGFKTPLTVDQLRSVFDQSKKSTEFAFVGYIMESHKNNKLECQVHSFFLKVLNEIRKENNLPPIKDDLCVIL